MAITKQEVKKLADLAKLELSEVEIELYQHQLEEVLDYVEKIKKLDLDKVALSLSGVGQRDIASPRADIVEEYTDDLVGQACQSQDHHIVSPNVIKK